MLSSAAKMLQTSSQSRTTESAPTETKAPSSSSQKKHFRDSDDDQSSNNNAKRPKVVQFHPDTDDNGLWATGRRFVSHNLRRQPTPLVYAGSSQVVEGFPTPTPSSDEDDAPHNARARRRSNRLTPKRKSRSGRGITPSHANGFATSIAYPSMSIVMTDEHGRTRAWEVSPDVFQDVSMYLQMRTIGSTSV